MRSAFFLAFVSLFVGPIAPAAAENSAAADGSQVAAVGCGTGLVDQKLENLLPVEPQWLYPSTCCPEAYTACAQSCLGYCDFIFTCENDPKQGCNSTCWCIRCTEPEP